MRHQVRGAGGRADATDAQDDIGPRRPARHAVAHAPRKVCYQMNNNKTQNKKLLLWSY